MKYSISFVQRQVLFLSNIIGSSLSFLACLILCIVILRSRKKLKDAYRRIIFGMAVYDMIMSIAGMAQMHRADDGNWGSYGNYYSAQVFTVFLMFGLIGSQLYNVGLSLYYFFILRKNYRERQFKTKVEPFIHIFIFLWALSGVISVLVTRSINPLFGTYWVFPYPIHCKLYEQVKCIRGEDAPVLSIIYVFSTALVSLVANFVLLGAIWWKVRSQSKRMEKYRIRNITAARSSTLSTLRKSKNSTDTSSTLGQPKPGGVLAQALAKRSEKANKRQEEELARARLFLIQSWLYGLVFLLCYVGPFVVMFMLLAGVKQTDIPYGLKIWNKVQTLQGILNIFVFTRPHVKNARKRNPNLGYLAAFKEVLLAGCDDDQTEQDRRRSSVVARNLRASAALPTSSALNTNPVENEVVMNEDMPSAAMMRAAKKLNRAAREERLRSMKQRSGSAVTNATAQQLSTISGLSGLDSHQEDCKNAESESQDTSSDEQTFGQTKAAKIDENQPSPDELV